MLTTIKYFSPRTTSLFVKETSRFIKRNMVDDDYSLAFQIKKRTEYIASRISTVFPELKSEQVKRAILGVAKHDISISEVATLINGVLPSSNICKYNGRLIQDESAMPSGAYKVRGATYALIKGILAGEDKFTCASAGNHSAGMAYAAQLLGVKLTVFLPETTPEFKQRIPEKFGADVVRVKGDLTRALEEAKSRAGTFIHPFDDPHVFKGQGSALFRLAEYAKESDTPIKNVYLPNGGGGLLAGSCLALNELLSHDQSKPYFQETKIVICQQEGQEKYVILNGILQKKVIPNCDLDFEGVAVRENPGQFFSIVNSLYKKRCIELISVSKPDILNALHTFNESGGFIEPTSAITLAASKPGEENVVFLTGRNCAPNDPRLIGAFSKAVSLK